MAPLFLHCLQCMFPLLLVLCSLYIFSYIVFSATSPMLPLSFLLPVILQNLHLSKPGISQKFSPVSTFLSSTLTHIQPTNHHLTNSTLYLKLPQGAPLQLHKVNLVMIWHPYALISHVKLRSTYPNSQLLCFVNMCRQSKVIYWQMKSVRYILHTYLSELFLRATWTSLKQSNDIWWLTYQWFFSWRSLYLGIQMWNKSN